MEAGKVNVRIPEPPRWLNAGRARQGGAALFGEYDSQGRWWMLIVHSDSILHSPYSYSLDDEPVTLDGSGYVYQKEFRLKTNKAKDPAETDGEGKGYIRIWTTTYSESDPTPARISALDSEFPSKWTSDHRLVGTTFSVVCMDALDIEHRYKIYRWRGPFNLGEPALSLVGDWDNMYDPRDETQTLGDRTTYKPSRNAALVWAWFRTHPFGRGKPESAINWDMIAEQADICDEDVTGIEGTQPRYEAGVAIVDSKRRADAEKEILLACDGQIVFDEDGKSWVRVGHWYDPTLSFSRNRDIMAMSSMEAQDGESETQGVIVRYIDPAANYTVQPSAAWINPLYYDPLTTPKFLVVDIQACQNHNQAMRLAKGIGMRSQPRHKIGPTVNLRGLRARQERIVAINYDNTFAGDYEIATPVELDGAGIFTGFGAVPINSSRWTLLEGEEQPKPVVDGTAGTISFPAISGETVYYSEGAIRIDFPALPRDDATYVAEYIRTADITGSENDPWTSMAVNVDTALSGPVQGGVSYTVRYRYVTGSGRGPAWEYDVVTPENPMSPPTELSATGGVGEAEVTWRNPTDAALAYVILYRNTVDDFGTASDISGELVGGLGQVMSVTDDSLSAGTYYFWVVAFNADDTPSSPIGSVSAVVT
ncbi:fibronectin type III domain-containing protein [Sphingopyxis indica]|nr:fibronectin type III domain-containing protein [Sphingopyxis indica]